MKNIKLSSFFCVLVALMLNQTVAAGNEPYSAGKKSMTEMTMPRSMIITDKKPNAPSLAITDSHRPLSVDDWENPEICGSCHTVQYQGWKGSMHSNSFKDPIFQAEWALAEKQVGANISNLCAGCHSPPGMLSKTIKFDPSLGKHGGFTAPPIAEQGVSCDVCHTISGSSFKNSEVLEHGNGSYIASPGPIKRGPLKDAESPYHETEYSEHHKQAKFCANCHNIFNPVNDFPLERTYDEWKYSVYAQNNIQCQDCHMVPVEIAIRVADEMKPVRELENHGLGGYAAIGAKKKRDVIHTHSFVGGNTVVTAAMGDPDSRNKSLIAIKRLRSVAELEIKLEKVKGQSGLHQLEVKVTNKRAGHDLPTSLTFIRELWLDVTVTDQDGKVILRSGALDSHKEVDPDATMFKAYAVDKEGKPAQYIWTVERFERRTTIPPKGHGYGRYAFILPEGTTDINVRSKLNYRSFSQHFVDHLLGKGEMEVPTVVMNDLELSYSAKNLIVQNSIDHNAQTDLEKEGDRLLEEYFGPEKAVKDTAQLVKACSVCHGNDGQGLTESFPNIGGQNKAYLLSALRAYNNGTRIETRMNAMLKDLPDTQLEALADYYSKMVLGYKPNMN